MRRVFRWCLLLPLLGAGEAAAQTLAATPPMGWTSEHTFGLAVTEQDVKAAADALVSNGMHRVGYTYVIVGDGWQGARDEDAFIQADAKKFPSGIKALADYVHDLGLGFGLSSATGERTCGGRLGSRGHEYQDALQYSRWGVDYLQYDWCNAEELSPQGAYLTMRDALLAAGRPVFFHIDTRGESEPWTWANGVGHARRTTRTVAACFTCIESHGSTSAWGVLPVVEQQDHLRAFAGPRRWNDPGALTVGRGMTAAEDRAQVSLWAMLAAPLLVGGDLASMADSTRAILTNPEVIAVDQDNLGVQGYRYRTDGALDVWLRPLGRGQLAVLFLNRGATKLQLAFDWRKHEVRDDLTLKSYSFATTTYEVRDLWAHERVGTTQEPLSTTLQSHDVLMLRLTPKK